MKSLRLCVVALVVVGLIGSGTLRGEPAYRADKRPLECFMKGATTWDAADIKAVKDLGDPFAKWPPDEKTRAALDSCGKTLWDKHQDFFRPLLEKWESLLRAALPKFTKEKVLALRSTTPAIDFKFCRDLGIVFRVVAVHRAWAGHPEEAVPLFLLTARFGQIVGIGDGQPPSCLHAMIGVALVKPSLDRPLWEILADPKLAHALLASASTHLANMAREEPSAEVPLAVEAQTSYNIVVTETYEKGSPKRAEILAAGEGKMTDAQLDTFVGVLSKEYSRLNGALLGMIVQYKSNPRELTKKATELQDAIEKSTKEPPTTPDGIWVNMARTMFGVSFANPGKFLEGMAEKQLRLEGGAILAAALVEEQGKPAKLSELADRLTPRMPVDMMAGTGDRCKLRIDGGQLIAYGVGKDGHDDLGDPKKDFVLFALAR